jgi:hypothetical protein
MKPTITLNENNSLRTTNLEAIARGDLAVAEPAEPPRQYPEGTQFIDPNDQAGLNSNIEAIARGDAIVTGEAIATEGGQR